ncbi:glutathione S-transferase family protein [Synechococcus sp. CS-602]|uniref:glutathione S-transferase family protein n=1 Tax=unclassified Synechococcus TaxID=2626047 RepID=UPI0008FF2A83|nr:MULTISPECIES: glutathione S-transferase family protein [unclassified Synechococcus]MCT4364320.1 glutathione S-transferase family protein [Candidatus Regnicoccus frigidus MAG-AL1]APD48881.1 glutathione S-transferase [Synechococcus sp. SynAce01]MCT0202375.1 glutathione S-transferase family protein [Synechococcus sp. CS-603]MCT0203767.1 glutathione S-transferase family protein [Synechococcus sp. CS-602]MCT0246456.1 glutathione S-transferase family protein [Synechococcus sp. CS-601]
MSALSWQELQGLALAEADRINGPTNAQARLRLFGQSEADVRVVLYRDHHAWCPYCQKVWLWLEEMRIPYRIGKVTMFCYGEKESWFKQLVPSGMLPALALDGRLITESDDILLALEATFGPLGDRMKSPAVAVLRRLERTLFRAWCQWLCVSHWQQRDEAVAERQFDRIAEQVDEVLQATPGPFFLERFGTADLIFTPYIERMNASLYYYKGYSLRQRHASIASWFEAMEERPTYRGTQSDFHTHAHDLPPQMGGCYPSGGAAQQACSQRVDQGPWPLAMPDDPETSQPASDDAPAEALARVLRHRQAILSVNPWAGEPFELALRSALSTMITGHHCSSPPGSAAALLYLRDRISVPRDMSLHAARALRQALTQTAASDPRVHDSAAPAAVPLPSRHRRDQDPLAFKRLTDLATASPAG